MTWLSSDVFVCQGEKVLIALINFLSTWPKLEQPGKTEPELRKYLHKTAMYTDVWAQGPD